VAAIPSPQYPEWTAGDEVDHVGAARQHLQTVFSEASLNPSSLEMTLLEAFAVVLGPVAVSFQKAPAAIMEHFMGLYAMRRYEGRKAVGKVKFRVSDAEPMVTIPSGTQLRRSFSDFAGALDFYTTEDVVIYTTETLEGEAWMEAAEFGTAYNGVNSGTPLETVNYMLQVDSIAVSETTRAGDDQESDASFEERSRAMLGRQTAALVFADQFESAALTREEVGRAVTINNWKADTATSVTGNVTVAVTDTTGNPLPPASRDAIRSYMQAQVLASLVVHVVDPNYTTVNLTVTVEAAPGTNHAEVATAVQDELTRRLDPMRWRWWSTITNLDIATWIDDVTGVARVVTVPAGVTLTGVAPLPRPGVFTVNVNAATR
jgi:hypothetical protein